MSRHLGHLLLVSKVQWCEAQLEVELLKHKLIFWHWMLALQAELPLVFFMYTVDCFVEASTVFYGSFSSEQSKLCLSNMCDRCHCYDMVKVGKEFDSSGLWWEQWDVAAEKATGKQSGSCFPPSTSSTCKEMEFQGCRNFGSAFLGLYGDHHKVTLQQAASS